MQTAGERDDGLGAGAPVFALLEVVVAVRPLVASWRSGRTEHIPQRPAVAAPLVQVARAAAGVVRDVLLLHRFVATF